MPGTIDVLFFGEQKAVLRLNTGVKADLQTTRGWVVVEGTETGLDVRSIDAYEHLVIGDPERQHRRFNASIPFNLVQFDVRASEVEK